MLYMFEGTANIDYFWRNI